MTVWLASHHEHLRFIDLRTQYLARYARFHRLPGADRLDLARLNYVFPDAHNRPLQTFIYDAQSIGSLVENAASRCSYLLQLLVLSHYSDWNPYIDSGEEASDGNQDRLVTSPSEQGDIISGHDKSISCSEGLVQNVKVWREPRNGLPCSTNFPIGVLKRISPDLTPLRITENYLLFCF